MKIALLAPFEESVPPKKYGGTELVVYLLAKGLAQRGHKIYLFAAGDSEKIPGVTLIPIFPKALRKIKSASDPGIRETFKYLGLAKILKALQKRMSDIDIIHDHISWRTLFFRFLFLKPTLTTLHGPLNNEKVAFIFKKFKELKRLPYISISNNQRKPIPDLNYVATVYNGIDISQFSFNDRPQDYFAFLGRMSPEKGPVQAIMAAKEAGVKLKMAAKVDAVDVEFFEREVKPLIDGNQIEFIGEIGPEEKNEFLKNARGLLAPIQWEEPFGLFMPEAMAAGTPVIAFKRGSVPELIIHGKTGFIVKPWNKKGQANIEGLVKAIKNIDALDRRACRRHVEENFTAQRMVENYGKVYQKILSS